MEPVLSLADAPRLASQAYDRLLDLILTGEVPGLMSERRLALRLGISRTPLRDAMRQLEIEGLLERLEDGRLQVRLLTAEDYIDNLHARRLIEGETARLAAGRMDPGISAGFRQRLERLLEGPDPADPPWRLDDELHGAIAAAAGSRRLHTLVRDLRREGHLIDPRRLPDRVLPGTREHLVLLDALDAGDGEAAAAAMREHLERVKADFLAHLAKGPA